MLFRIESGKPASAFAYYTRAATRCRLPRNRHCQFANWNYPVRALKSIAWVWIDVNSETLKNIFDDQVEEMIALIDEQMWNLQKTHSEEHIVSLAALQHLSRNPQA